MLDRARMRNLFNTLTLLVARAYIAIDRAVRWSLASVEEDRRPRVVHVPGPAHGPVPAIRLRLEEQRRKAS
jgi:hypothetical protein